MRVIGTAGHVDHGKSSLVLALTGTDPDRFAEEKRRGLTIDLGFAWTTLPSGAGVSFVDVPGHVRFLKNMLAGVGAIDACLFVVAATEGWKPQSEEHLRILELLGVRHGIVALTKVDLVDDELADIATLDVADHVAGTFLEGAPIVAVAAPAGVGLDAVRSALDGLVATTPAAADRDRARLWVDRAFAARGAGTVVTGTLTGGAIAVDDGVVVGPSARPARVRGIQTLGRAVERIGPGNRVAVNLSGIDHDQVTRGDAVVAPGRWHSSAVVDASLRVLGTLDHDVSRRGAYLPTSARASTPPGSACSAVSASTPVPTASCACACPCPCRCCPVTASCSARAAGTRPSVAARCSTSPRSWPRPGPARPFGGPRHRRAGLGRRRPARRLTGEHREPDLGRWVAAPGALDALVAALAERVDGAGALGLDVATLDERSRSALALVPGVAVDAGRALAGGGPGSAGVTPGTGRPGGGRVRAARGRAGPDRAARAGAPRARGRVGRAPVRAVGRGPGGPGGGAAAGGAHAAAGEGGFTVGHVRDAVGATRKHVVPLLAELDRRGVTRRRGDRRIAGPRLPPVDD